MDDSTASRLNDEIDAWCVRAEEAVDNAPDDVAECLALVREGILLRRRWDRTDRSAAPRRRLLGLLAAVQAGCHQKLAAAVAQRKNGPPSPDRVERMLRRLAEDDRYLAELLDDRTLPAETVAFAVECFRDDVHWLGTLVALLDGAQGIDFAGRVLLEQESLQRTLDAQDAQDATAVPDSLRHSARRLRATALARRAQSLLQQPRPTDLDGWYRAWQAAGRLSMRPKGTTDEEIERAVETFRSEAIERWKAYLDELPDDRRQETLRRTADELADTAAESLTFVEDLPLPEAVRTLEVLAEDAAICRKAVSQYAAGLPRKFRRALRRRQKAVAAELQERRLGWRLEGLFGRTAVARLERFILLLLILFVVMLAVETPLVRYQRAHWPNSNLVLATCAWLDLGICLVFLTEFTLKWSLARPRGLYFRRNWITGLVPAIPVGFIIFITTHLDRVDVEVAGEAFVLLRGLRYLRLPQMARWLRIARPVLRVGRLIAFSAQASDRLVRRLAPLLNRNLVLFEQAAIKIDQPPYRIELAALRERFAFRAGEVFAELPPGARQELIRARIEDLTAMLSGPHAALVAPSGSAETSATREIPLEQIVAWLLAATPAGVSDRLGRSLAMSVARWCRAFDVFGVRRLPLIRSLVAAGRRSSPYGTTAEVANHLGSLMKHLLDRVYWVADLYGTVTAPQLVDSIGDWMVRRTARPARRLLIFGFALLTVSYLASLLPMAPLRDLTHTLDRLVGTPLVVLGLLCLVPLLVGLWFRQIAGEASNFFGRVAEAQFIAATKKLKARFAEEHRAMLERRVIEPEGALDGHCDGAYTSVDEAGVEAAEEAELEEQGPLTPALSQRERGEVALTLAREERETTARRVVELLFDDYLDGAPFHRSDTKTTTQLLGNLTLVSLCQERLCYGRRLRKRLRRLDLATGRTSLRGPYLWFHFISRSMAQQTAKLVVDYNTHALPLDRAAAASEGQVERYVGWLAGRLKVTEENLPLPPEFARRPQSPADATNRRRAKRRNRRTRGFHGNDFTAIHFLSADPQLEADVRRRYGDAVADLMHGDRRDNVRRVFRTFPFHHRPKPDRTVNPLALYGRYLAGGRVLLLPFRLVLFGVGLSVRGVRQIGRFVHEVLHPTVGDLDAVAEPDPYAVAVRKILRMRQPVFMECLRMRAEFDPEYLGVSLPDVSPGGETGSAPRITAAPVEEDLGLIDADPGVRQQYRRQAAERRRQMLEFHRAIDALGLCVDRRESLRAMAIAYAIDYRRLRSRHEAVGRLRQAFDEALADSPQTPSDGTKSGGPLRTFWCRFRRARRLDRLFELPPFSAHDAQQRAVLRRLIARRRGPLLAAACELTRRDAPDDPLDDVRALLQSTADDPAPWSRQLVVLRAVQTLSALDLRTYCDLVAELGEYDAHRTDENCS